MAEILRKELSAIQRQVRLINTILLIKNDINIFFFYSKIFN